MFSGFSFSLVRFSHSFPGLAPAVFCRDEALSYVSEFSDNSYRLYKAHEKQELWDHWVLAWENSRNHDPEWWLFQIETRLELPHGGRVKISVEMDSRG